MALLAAAQEGPFRKRLLGMQLSMQKVDAEKTQTKRVRHELLQCPFPAAALVRLPLFHSGQFNTTAKGGDQTQRKKLILTVLTLGIIIAAASTAWAAITLYYHMPQSATVPSQASLSIYVDGQPWINGTEVGWGTVNPGEIKQKTVDIYNVGTKEALVNLLTSGLPSGWDLAYNRNSTTLNAGQWLNGTMALTVPMSAAPGSFFWTVDITAS
jgi:hypothetical protein